MKVAHVGIGLVLLALLSGCSDDGDSLQVTPASSSSPSLVSPTATSSASSPSDEVGGIPADLFLPGQAEGRVDPPEVGRLYDYVCLDPPVWMNSPASLDARTVIIEDRTGTRAITIERLVLYQSAAQADKAVRGLLAQVDLCGNHANHVGTPSTWRAAEVTGLPGADRALRLTYRTEGVVGTVVILARVGRAVFYIDRRQLYAGGVADDQRTVAAFVPALAAAFP